MSNSNETQGATDAGMAGMLKQGWIGVACWMSVGLLLEGLMAYKTPSYLNDPQRRELFTLAHAHGTLLNAILVLAALTGLRFRPLPRIARVALRTGALLMPLGFLLAGIGHPEGDPGVAIWLVPPAALLTIYGAVSTALSLRHGPSDRA